jgi:hypothetical protein
MAQTGHLTQAPRTAGPPLFSAVTWLRIAIIVAAVVLWESVGAIATSIDIIKNAVLTAFGAPPTAVGSLNASNIRLKDFFLKVTKVYR